MGKQKINTAASLSQSWQNYHRYEEKFPSIIITSVLCISEKPRLQTMGNAFSFISGHVVTMNSDV